MFFTLTFLKFFGKKMGQKTGNDANRGASQDIDGPVKIGENSSRAHEYGGHEENYPPTAVINEERCGYGKEKCGVSGWERASSFVLNQLLCAFQHFKGPWLVVKISDYFSKPKSGAKKIIMKSQKLILTIQINF